MSSVAEVTVRSRTRRFSPRSAARLRHLSLRGAAIVYLGAMVALPVAAIIAKGYGEGLGSLRSALAVPGATAAIRLTLITSAITALINAVVGTLIAYVLVRFRFPGRNALSAVVDLPIAIPTLVTGLALVALYGPNSAIGGALERAGIHVVFAPLGIELALLFITLPFVIRTVQPVLLELDPAEEEAASTLGANGWTTFRRIVLPALVPALLSGAGLAFARAIGEYGSVVLIGGGIPHSTEGSSQYIAKQIETDRPANAAAVSLTLLLVAFVVLLVLRLVAQRSQRHEGASP